MEQKKNAAPGYFVFSGGEVHGKFPLATKENPSVQVVCKDYTMNGFMAICQQQVFSHTGGKVDLVYPYFPYARQDRIMDPNEPFSLKIFCELLNSRKFNSVTILDPHSDVVGALVDNCRIVPQWEVAKKVIPAELFENEDVIFVSPDAGAYKKISKLISNDKRIAIATKERDSTGAIVKTSVYSRMIFEEKTCVIVDDICDGGRTFIELAKVLKAERGAHEVILYVTHGIFSQGLDPLRPHIDKIYTTNSFANKSTEDGFLTVVNIS